MDVTNATEMPAYCTDIDRDFLQERFWLVVVLGITVSAISIIENVFLFLVFITNAQHRNSYNLYLLLLAFFDVFMSVSYIMVISGKVLTTFTESYTMKWIWTRYMVPMLTVSHIAMTASSYLITAAAIERYCITVSNRLVDFLQRNRKLLAATAVFIGVLSKVTIMFEIQIVNNEECEGTLNEWQVAATSLVYNTYFNKIWRFYFRNIATILAPFFVLLFLNARLVTRLQRHSSAKTLEVDKQSVKQKKARIRAVTRTLVILVCTYLLSNLLSVIITFWEYFDVTSLFQEYTTFYVISVDTVSLLTIIACSLRLPIYASCQPLLRKEMINFVSQLWSEKRLVRRMTLIEQNMNGVTLDAAATRLSLLDASPTDL